MQKIGLLGDNDRLLSMGTMLNHMSNVKEYPYLKTKLLEYVKSGDCPPRDYIEMVDRFTEIRNLESEYGLKGDILDTVKINRNRKLIGFPSYDHWKKITKDYWKSEREKNDTDYFLQ